MIGSGSMLHALRRASMTVVLAAVIATGAIPAAGYAQEESADVDAFSRAVFFGQKFFDLGEHQSAYEQFAKANELRPDEPGVLYNMALLLAKTGKYPEAQERIDRYIRLYPEGSERTMLNRLQLEIGFERELEQKRQVDRQYSELFTRAEFLYLQNDLAGALRLFQEAESRRPTDPAAVCNQGVVQEMLGQYQAAALRFRRCLELESDGESRAAIEQRALALEQEVSEMQSKFLCPFCGHRLPLGATWCPRCWHGPYQTSSAAWNTRPCLEGASSTRAMYYLEDRLHKSETLRCAWDGTMAEALRYSPEKQKAIQDARKAAGWSFRDGMIVGWRDEQGGELRYLQGPDTLERIESTTGGEILTFDAHRSGENWLLDRDETIIEGRRFRSHYTYDAANRIVRQDVEYQNTDACNHLISMTADLIWQGEDLAGATIRGVSDGHPTEGAPHTEWEVSIALTMDGAARVTEQNLAVVRFDKTYTRKPVGAARDEVNALYPTMRVKQPIKDLMRSGDLCAISGTTRLGNQIDLRPFHILPPDLAIEIPFGVVRAVVTTTYPDSFRPR